MKKREMTDTRARSTGPAVTPAEGRRNVSRGEARAAARLQIVLDQKRGRPTEPWIVELAAGR